MSNISSLGDIRKKENKDKQNELYIGGIDQKGGGSGLAVIGPPGGPSKPPQTAGSGIFDRIVERAQGHSEESSGPLSESAGNQRVITLYRNGFVVDDGPFRDLTSPDNQQFIKSLVDGRVPAEMSQGATADIEVSLNDKRTEDYVAPPPPAYVAFSKGMALGSSSAGSRNSAWVSSDDGSSVEIDENQPHSTLQIKTYEGKRMLIKMNNNATVLQLAAAIRSQWGVGTPVPFTLSSGFPPKDLCDPSLTLTAAGLTGSSIVMKKA